VASHRAEHDPLTGLKNRAGIERELAHCLGLARTQDNHTTLLFIDLDGFKQVNDDYGHDVGDLVLIECAQRLKRLVRQEIDFVGRLGGDEMVLVLNGMEADSDVVGAMAQRVVRALSLPVVLAGGRQVHIGASVGVAGYPIHASNPTALIRVADAAMYRVKREGKNNFAVADSSLTLESDMMGLEAQTSMRDAPTTV
jgi:diguanylate cyclase (GGDEF)-like protein